jgi:hypothetical protein
VTDPHPIGACTDPHLLCPIHDQHYFPHHAIDQEEDPMFGRKDNDAVAAHKDAKNALHANQQREQATGVTEETDTYRELNARVLETEKNVPWHRR